MLAAADSSLLITILVILAIVAVLIFIIRRA
jgi:hypothetical protein